MNRAEWSMKRASRLGDALAARSGAQPDRAIGAGKGRGSNRRRTRSAIGEEGVDLHLVAAKLDEPRAERGEQRHQGLGQDRLERAEALAGETRANRGFAFVAERGED